MSRPKMNPDRRASGFMRALQKIKDGARREKDYAILMTLPPNPLGGLSVI